MIIPPRLLLVLLLILSGCGASSAPATSPSPSPANRAAPPVRPAPAALGAVGDTTIPAPPQSAEIRQAPAPASPAGLMLGSIQPELEQRFQAEGVVTDRQDAYTSTLTLNGLVSFYRDSMSERGWRQTQNGEQITAENAFLAFESAHNGALIMLFDLAAFDDQGVLVMTANTHKQ